MGAQATPNARSFELELLRTRQRKAAVAPSLAQSWSSHPAGAVRRNDLGLTLFNEDRPDLPVYIAAKLGAAKISTCGHCGDQMVWVRDRIAWPLVGASAPPNPDLPEPTKANYLEASAILDISPRAAAGLLRVCIEELCEALEANGRNLDERIAALVSGGLPVEVQQALDLVRVIGNEAVHPGQMDLRDDRQIAASLFHWVNYIAERMIGEPKRAKQAFESLPPNKLKAIEERNARTLAQKEGGAP